jgi:murein L,D-transpeptidase YcbB/YkuD
MAFPQQNSRNRFTPLVAAWSFSVLVMAFGTAARAESPQYQRLQDALVRYEQIVDAGGWPAVPAGSTIEPGSADPRVGIVAQRLVISGDLPDSAREFPIYSEALQTAVRRFQARHGLEQDAKIGKQTLRALNVQAAKRVEQLRLNMERTRQVFATNREDFLLVNIPAFSITLFRDGKKLSKARVIVGETEMQTPLFEAELRSVVLNPTWTVPRKIASEELLPKIQADVGYLVRKAYDVVNRDGARLNPSSIDWASLNRKNFPFTLVQRPGPNNELGRIKFLFPNDYGVCMHDTPNKALFARDARAFSHGCVRLQDPIVFAKHVLGPEGWTGEQIAAQLATGKTHAVALKEPLPIVLVYLTAEASDDGTVYFYRDIYSRDAG